MKNYEVKLLDCTLRDGGYVNNWNWGYDVAKDIVACHSRWSDSA